MPLVVAFEEAFYGFRILENRTSSTKGKNLKDIKLLKQRRYSTVRAEMLADIYSKAKFYRWSKGSVQSLWNTG